MLHRKTKRHIHSHPRYYLAIGFMASLILLTAGVLLSLTQQIDQNQDIRRSASVGENNVAINIAPVTATINTEVTVPFTVSKFSEIYGLNLAFTIVGPEGMIQDVTATPSAGALETKKFNITNVVNGKRVRYAATAKNTGAGATLPDGAQLLALKFTPKTTGSVTIQIDESTSMIVHISDHGANIMQTPAQSTFPVTDPAAALPTKPQIDDLYLKDYSFSMHEGDRQVSANQLEDGKSYRVTVNVTAQNIIKNANSTENANIVVKLQAADSGIKTYNFSYAQLQKAVNGLSLQLETPFIAKSETKFVTTIDANNVIAESNETNNTAETVITNQRSSTSIGGAVSFTSSCNVYCANDSECNFGLSCWNNQCRHPQNTASSRCEGPNSSVAGCNIRCESSANCASGLVCSSNYCRNPLNPSSSSCQSPASGNSTTQTNTQTTTQQVPVPVRTAPKPIAQTKTTATPNPKATPTSKTGNASQSAESAQAVQATVSATPTPISVTAITPIPTPSATPETVQDEVFTALIKKLPMNAGIWLILGGVGLLLLIVLLAVFGRKKKHTPLPPPPATKPQAVSFKPGNPVQSQQLPAKPVTTVPVSPLSSRVPTSITSTPSSAPAASSSLATGSTASTAVNSKPMPTATGTTAPTVPPQVSGGQTNTSATSTSTSANAAQNQSSMMQRLQSRGVNVTGQAPQQQ